MKWVLLWLMIGPNGSPTSGAEPFPNPEACWKVAAAMKLQASDLTAGRGRTEANCYSAETGDVAPIKPRT